MIGNAAEHDSREMRAEFDRASRRLFGSKGDRKWSAWMRDVEHPKRSMIIQLIVLMAAGDLWKNVNKKLDWGGPEDPFPFSTTNPDVIVAEALIFFWYNFFIMVGHAVRKHELSKADTQAVSTALASIVHFIQEYTQWPVTDFMDSRTSEYQNRDSSQNPTDIFLGVLLRSRGKKSIRDPDARSFTNLNFSDTPLIARTMIHLTTFLPTYFDVYKDLVAKAPMD
jgi:hypothetical protein